MPAPKFSALVGHGLGPLGIGKHFLAAGGDFLGGRVVKQLGIEAVCKASPRLTAVVITGMPKQGIPGVSRVGDSD